MIPRLSSQSFLGPESDAIFANTEAGIVGLRLGGSTPCPRSRSEKSGTVMRGPFANRESQATSQNLPVLHSHASRGSYSLRVYVEVLVRLQAQLPECARLYLSRSGIRRQSQAESCLSCTFRNRAPYRLPSRAGRSPFGHRVRRYASVHLPLEK
jgi:hypothetical protein